MADTRLYKVAITPKGKYVHGTEYDALCQVLYATEDGGDGCCYISLKPNKNVRPGTDSTVWAISMERGEKGETGAGFSDIDVSVNNTSGTPSATAVIENDTLYLSFSGLKGEDGQSGTSGKAPIIGNNGNWWIWDDDEDDYVDTNLPSHGADGTDGQDGVDGADGEPGVGFESVETPTPADGTAVITLSNGDTITLDLNHNHDSYVSKLVGTAQPSGGFLPDVAYNLGEISGTVTFALANAVTGQLNHYFWTFSTGGTAPTVTFPSTGITWAAGSAPTVAANKKYEISILNGVAYYSEV